MAMTEQELLEQERRAHMLAAGIDVGKIDGVALVAEVRRLQAANLKLREACSNAFQDHYSEPEGLSSCPASSLAGGTCGCGAAEVNAMLTAALEAAQ